MNSTSKKYKRIAELDIIKSIAIYLVIWGHCLQSLYPVVGSGYNKPAFLYIYSFHMPLFMLVSGYLSLSALNRGIKDIIIKKVKQLLIPAFVTSGLCAIVEYMFTMKWGGYYILSFMKYGF